MSISPLIRIAVNLCLVAVIVIQPIVSVAAHGTCAQGTCLGPCPPATTVCSGCKCCEVQSRSNLCGCCSGSEKKTGNCCSAKSGEQNAAKPKVHELFGEISEVVPEPPSAGAEGRPDEAAQLSSCTCGVQSAPLGQLPNRVPMPNARNFVVLSYLSPVVSDVGLLVRPDAVTSRLPIGDFSPHFSQRFLCVWRI